MEKKKPECMRQFWNERYEQEVYIYGEAPNAFVRQFLDALPAGKLLLPAEGEGRNAVYAAKRGWEVRAFDFSSAGRQKALRLAKKFGLSIHYELASIQEYAFPVHAMDAAALTYVHLPPELRIFLHQKVVESLRPGGQLALEAFSKAQLPNDSGGPKKEEMLFSTAMLEEDFRDLQIDLLREEEVILEEGLHHRGKANLVRLLARKP